MSEQESVYQIPNQEVPALQKSPEVENNLFSIDDVVAIRRTSGEIDPGWKVVLTGVERKNKETGDFEAAVIVEKTINFEVYEKRVSVGELTELNATSAELNDKEPSLHEKAAEDLGGQALDSFVTSEDVQKVRFAPENLEQNKAEAPMTLAEQTKDLSDNDRQDIETYLEAKAAKAAAQRSGDGQLSMDEGQAMGQAFLRMSPGAQAVARRYA